VQLIDERAISRGMVKVESGEDLVESLQALASAAGWVDAMVSGAGTLELVELMTAAGQSETLEEAELLSLSGRIHVGPEGKRLVTLRASVMAAGAVHVGRITAALTGA
jgi:predicted DNA-binding protein with PD1-like motif